MRRQYLLLFMGLGPSASRPSGHNTKRSATAGRFFYLQNKPAGSGSGLLNRLAAGGGWGSRPLFCAKVLQWGQTFPRICWRVSSAEPCRVKAGAVTPNAALFYMLHS